MIINGFVPSQNIFNFDVNGIDRKQKVKGNSFTGILKEKLDEVNDKQLKADALTSKMIKGENVDVHKVMLAGEEAKLSLQLAVQVRNKLLEAYQEINRMQL